MRAHKLCVASLVCFICLGLFERENFVGLSSVAQAQEAQRPRAHGPRSIAPVAERLIEAVVNISTTQVSKDSSGVPLPVVPEGSPFDEFFEDFFDGEGNGLGAPRKVSSLGSGFVIDGKNGFIVTNNHVITDADEIIINFHDGSKLKVERIVGVDKNTDIALLKVSPDKPLVDVSFGRSGDMRVGDWVMAIGNPFGLGGSVTIGIVSAKQRDIRTGPYDDYLQTDAAINKGNSGGPLFNLDGDVVGINTAIISPTGGSIGIGFAVPSDVAASVVEQLKEHGEVRRGWLGVKVQTVSEEIAETVGVPANTGALVSAVQPGSPAEKGGIREGDVILDFDGTTVSRMRGLPRIVSRSRAGESVKVHVLRDGKKLVLDVMVGLLRDDGKAGKRREAGGAADGTPRLDPKRPVLGMTLKALDDELRAKYGLSASMHGVVVTDVSPGSAADRKGIRAGDVVVEVAQSAVRVPEDVVAGIEKVRGLRRDKVLMHVEDALGHIRFVALPIDGGAPGGR